MLLLAQAGPSLPCLHRLLEGPCITDYLVASVTRQGFLGDLAAVWVVHRYAPHEPSALHALRRVFGHLGTVVQVQNTSMCASGTEIF